MHEAIQLCDLDYDIFIKENAIMFHRWKGALTHEGLCKLDIMTRYKYIEEFNKLIKLENKKMNDSSAGDYDA